MGRSASVDNSLMDAATATAADHRLGCELREEERAFEVGVNRLIPHLFTYPNEQTRWEDSGVIDQDVDASEPLHRLVDHFLRIF